MSLQVGLERQGLPALLAGLVAHLLGQVEVADVEDAQVDVAVEGAVADGELAAMRLPDVLEALPLLEERLDHAHHLLELLRGAVHPLPGVHAGPARLLLGEPRVVEPVRILAAYREAGPAAVADVGSPLELRAVLDHLELVAEPVADGVRAPRALRMAVDPADADHVAGRLEPAQVLLPEAPVMRAVLRPVALDLVGDGRPADFQVRCDGVEALPVVETVLDVPPVLHGQVSALFLGHAGAPPSGAQGGMPA